MSKLKKPINVKLLEEAESYFFSQNDKIQAKFLIAFAKTESGLIGDWFQKLKGTDGIFEFRLRDEQKFYRMFAFWDSDDKNSLIIGTHGFDKKSNRTPQREIDRAEKMKSLYLENKK